MALADPRFVACFPPQIYFVDKDNAQALSAGIVTFYKDNDRTVLKTVYQQSGTPGNYVYIPLVNNPITLTSVGTFADDNGDDIIPFLFPYEGTPDDSTGEVELYYITVYAAVPPVGSAALQFTREGWPPNIGSGSNPPITFDGTENELANPQFVTVNFQPNPATSSYVFNVSGANTVNTVAPDWDIITNGTGTVTVKQRAVVDVDAPSNPPYALDITSSGITSLSLRQRLTASPRLLANGFLNGYFIAASEDSTAHQLILNYIPSTGTSHEIANDFTSADGLFNGITGTVDITPSDNTDSAQTGYVDITLSIPVGAHIQVSSFQIVAVQTLASSTPFLQESTARQKDHLWHYYQQQVLFQPKVSILSGWNFSLNPWQFTTTSASTVVGSAYKADQTIIARQNASSLQSIRTTQGYFGVQSIVAQPQGKFAIIQYVDQSTINPYWGNVVSSLVRAGISTRASTNLTFKMRLIYRGSLPVITVPGVLDDPINSWAATDPTFTAGWTALAPINDPVYTLEQGALDTYTFEGFELPAFFSATAMIGVVLYTTSSMSAASVDLAFFDRISLVPNRFAVDSPPQTYDQVLRECQFYYESSYAQQIIPQTPLAGGCLFAIQDNVFVAGTPSQFFLLTRNFGFPFKNICRTNNPTMILYSPENGTINSVFGQQFDANNTNTNSGDIASSNWDEMQKSSTGVSFESNNNTQFLAVTGASTNTVNSWIYYHYTKDGRLGLVA